MDENILAPFGNIDYQFRENLRNPGNAKTIGELALLWMKATHDMLEPIQLYCDFQDESAADAAPACFVPNGFGELTGLLMFWCDTTPTCRIDPAPLSDFLDTLFNLVADWMSLEPNAFVDCCKAQRRARQIIIRMCVAANHAVGQEPPKELEIIASSPRYKPGKCPDCKARLRVSSTQGKTRYLACTKCKYTGKYVSK